MQSKIITIENFHATKLNNNRNIYIYLPPGYEAETNKRYPVLYMHDGQYVFAKSENTGSSWDADKVADSLISSNKIKKFIIVAVPNMANERGSEYSHDPIPFIKEFGLKSNGLLYEDFLIHDLKPYIDANFRTLTDSANTALLGSSMGGLATYNIGFRNPDVFGNLGIMSPFLVTMNPETLQESLHYKLYEGKKPQKLWVDIGEYENLILERHVRQFADALIGQGMQPEENIVFYDVPNAAHFERDWSERLSAPFLYFFGDTGKRKSAHLYGSKTVGLNGMIQKINAVVDYDSGFIMSDLDGEYIIEEPDILEVERDGTVLPRKVGTTKVTYRSNGIEVSDTYQVITELSEFVTLTVNVTVPENTPEDLPLKLNEFFLNKTNDRLYTGKFKLPRNCALSFKITRGNSFVKPCAEQDENGNDIPYRKLKITEDMEINLTVEGWRKEE